MNINAIFETGKSLEHDDKSQIHSNGLPDLLSASLHLGTLAQERRCLTSREC